MTTPVIERTSSTGIAVRVEVESAAGYPRAIAYIADVATGDAVKVQRIGKTIPSPIGPMTHFIGKLALTELEADKVQRAIDAAVVQMRQAAAAANANDLVIARTIFADAIAAKYAGECAVTPRGFGKGSPIVNTRYGWAIADRTTLDALTSGKGQRWDILSRAMSRDDSDL